MKENLFDENVKNFKDSMNYEYAGLTPAEKLIYNLENNECYYLLGISADRCKDIADDLHFFYIDYKNENGSCLTSALATIDHFKDSFEHQQMIMTLSNYMDLGYDYSKD